MTPCKSAVEKDGRMVQRREAWFGFFFFFLTSHLVLFERSYIPLELSHAT